MKLGLVLLVRVILKAAKAGGSVAHLYRAGGTLLLETHHW